MAITHDPAIFQSTLPLRGATRFPLPYPLLLTISIHAPLAGSDPLFRRLQYSTLYFNPRSPCGERRAVTPLAATVLSFQSTLPLRGATKGREENERQKQDFNPRSPCGERRRNYHMHGDRDHFNPRSPCGERRKYPVPHALLLPFQSTPPLRGPTTKWHRKL